jgi:hypothetical protein
MKQLTVLPVPTPSTLSRLIQASAALATCRFCNCC